MGSRYDPMLPATTFEFLGFPSILFTTVAREDQGFSGLDFKETHERRQERCMQESVHRLAGNFQNSSSFKLCCF